MQTRSHNPPLQYEADINNFIQKLRSKVLEEKEKAMTTN